jgi:DNA-binding transcriptional LysR family regulator
VSDARRTFAGEAAAGGRLQLGVTSLVAGYVLSDILARYRRAFPGVEVSAIEDNGDYLEHLLVGGELDVAVMVISNLRDRMALQAEIIEVSPYRLWLPLGHHLAGADSIGIQDIAREPLIMLTVDEIEENTGKLLVALGAPARRLPHPLGGGGAQPGRDRRRHRAAAGPRLPAVVAGRRPHREPRRVGLAAGRAGGHGLAARLRPAAGGQGLHRRGAIAAAGPAAAIGPRRQGRRRRRFRRKRCDGS